MSYDYREVKCLSCGHIFMWNKNGNEDSKILIHRLKETGEHLRIAKCPKCGIDMAVLNSVLEGIDPKDERIETIGIRGI